MLPKRQLKTDIAVKLQKLNITEQCLSGEGSDVPADRFRSVTVSYRCAGRALSEQNSAMFGGKESQQHSVALISTVK